MRLVRICRSRPGSPRNRVGRSGAIALANSMPLLSARSASSSKVLSTVSIRSKSSSSQTQFARFNFGKVQNVINDRQQGVRAGVYGFGELALLRVEVAV